MLYSYRWWDYFVPSVVPHAIGGYELAFAAVAGVVLLRYDARIRFSFYRRHPSLLVLAGEPTGASDRELASDFTNVLELVNARFVAVHRDLMDANQLAAIDRLIGSNARLVVWKREGDLAVFRRQ